MKKRKYVHHAIIMLSESRWDEVNESSAITLNEIMTAKEFIKRISKTMLGKKK